SQITRSEHVDTVDPIGVPSFECSDGRVRVLFPRETNVGGTDGYAVLPRRHAQTERRDEPSVWSGRIVGDQAQTAVLIRRDGFRQTGYELVVVVATRERLRDRAREKTR